MSIVAFVRTAFHSSLDTLGGENVQIGNHTHKGVIEDIGTELMLGEGGDEVRRGLRITFPGDAFPSTPARRATVTCRSQTWQITRVDNSPASITIEVEEPEARGR